MKKFLIVLATVAVSFLCAVGITMAYFTDSVETENNIVISGNIHITQNEQERVKASDGGYTGQLQKYTQNQTLVPLVQHGSAEKETVQIGGMGYALPTANSKNYIDKIVTVKNVGLNPTYLRTFIAIPTGGHVSSSPDGDNWFRWNRNSEGWSWTKPGSNSWDMIDDADINGVTYDIYVATYTTKLAFGETTSPSLLGFYLDSSVNYNGTNYSFTAADGQRVKLGSSSVLEILVATQATQTTTFDDPWTALDTVFGEVSADNHPWHNDSTYYAADNDAFHALLKSGTISSGSTICLSSGTYTLPETLPNDLRLVGRGDVSLTAPDTISAYYVTFADLTFLNDVNFRGNGTFTGVDFQGSVTATFVNPAYFIECSFTEKPVCSFTESAVRRDILFDRCSGLS